MTKTWLRALTLVATLVLIILSGTLYFAWVEGWSHLDSYFFTVVTLSTVGYGNLVPATAAGKIGTTIFIFLGLGVFVAAVQQFGAFAMRKREEHVDSLMAMLANPEPPANEDDAPEDSPKAP
ncbi:potassium channel family protein [Mesobacterium sp. TK19101]|uniref:Potassium channel family protein n=1 Tax=Mesobacterium hydrothermale TaxID=3111907 RepID=A0ABU6HIE1_9RHOB|nr:potassium channel family protein [Mesobacterium sp. TK19101]MEC3862106.1 potassium channel family protein [Mesobacterium sp. TK19101]